jgi:hypothetical protein
LSFKTPRLQQRETMPHAPDNVFSPGGHQLAFDMCAAAATEVDLMELLN